MKSRRAISWIIQAHSCIKLLTKCINYRYNNSLFLNKLPLRIRISKTTITSYKSLQNVHSLHVLQSIFPQKNKKKNISTPKKFILTHCKIWMRLILRIYRELFTKWFRGMKIKRREIVWISVWGAITKTRSSKCCFITCWCCFWTILRQLLYLHLTCKRIYLVLAGRVSSFYMRMKGGNLSFFFFSLMPFCWVCL